MPLLMLSEYASLDAAADIVDADVGIEVAAVVHIDG
jgi:hypothetical protein